MSMCREIRVGKSIISPRVIEEIVVGHCLVIVAHICRIYNRVLTSNNGKRLICDAEVRAEGHGGAGDAADSAKGVDEIVSRIEPAIVKPDEQTRSVRRHRQGRLPLIVGCCVIVDPYRRAPSRPAIRGLREKDIRPINIGWVVIEDNIDITVGRIRHRLGEGISAEAAIET